MNKTNLTMTEYRDWLKEIKQRVRQAQVKVAHSILSTGYYDHRPFADGWFLGAHSVA